MPRSGNHLLRGCLDHHKDLIVPPCEDYLPRNLVRSFRLQIRAFFTSSSKAKQLYQFMQKEGHFESVNHGNNINIKSNVPLLDLEKYYTYVEEQHRFGLFPSSIIKIHFKALELAISDNIIRSEKSYYVCFSALRSESKDLLKLHKLLSKEYEVKTIVTIRNAVQMINSVRGRSPGVSIESLCKRYKLFLEQAEMLKKKSVSLLILSFEEFINNQQVSISKICDFLEISDDKILRKNTLYGEEIEKNSSFQPGNRKLLLSSDEEALIDNLIQGK